VQTRWTLPRNRADEDQDLTRSDWATFHQPNASEYVGKGKLPFAPPCRMPLQPPILTTRNGLK
jgi:hypothetical protein